MVSLDSGHLHPRDQGVSHVDMSEVQAGTVVRGERVDATAKRESIRQRRLLRTACILLIPLGYAWYRELTGNPMRPRIPNPLNGDPMMLMAGLMMTMMMCLIMIPLLGAGRSPHTLLRP